MKLKFLIVGLVAGVFALAPVFSANVQAEEKASAAPAKKVKAAAKKATVTDKASAITKTRGEAVSNKALLNDPGKTVAAPPAKGGEKTRGAYCTYTVDNWTNLKAVIFVDGEEVGLVSAWGKASGYLLKGDHTIKGVAYFTDGSEQYWGPRDFFCGDEYTWKITR